jgi:hypothetical protein
MTATKTATPEVIGWGTVAEALAAITAELPGIAKERHPTVDGRGNTVDNLGYAYRGIEDITKVLQGLLARHGVTFIPRAEVVSITDLPHKGNGTSWTRTILRVEYQIAHASLEFPIPGPCCIGIGDDNADKGANKAMSQAFKYALLQTFCISDPKDDTDGVDTSGEDAKADTTSTRTTTRKSKAQREAEAKAAEPVPAADPPAQAEVKVEVPEGWGETTPKDIILAHNALALRIGELPSDVHAECIKKRNKVGWPMKKSDFDALTEFVMVAETLAPPAAEPTEADAPTET